MNNLKGDVHKFIYIIKKSIIFYMMFITLYMVRISIEMNVKKMLVTLKKELCFINPKHIPCINLAIKNVEDVKYNM